MKPPTKFLDLFCSKLENKIHVTLLLKPTNQIKYLFDSCGRKIRRSQWQCVFLNFHNAVPAPEIIENAAF